MRCAGDLSEMRTFSKEAFPSWILTALISLVERVKSLSGLRDKLASPPRCEGRMDSPTFVEAARGTAFFSGGQRKFIGRPLKV